MSKKLEIEVEHGVEVTGAIFRIDEEDNNPEIAITYVKNGKTRTAIFTPLKVI